MGRKNHYGSRSERGTRIVALFYSLIKSAKQTPPLAKGAADHPDVPKWLELVRRQRMHRHRRVMSVAAILLLACSSLGVLDAADVHEQLQINDAHVHLVDFLQNGDFLENGELLASSPAASLRSGERGKRIEALLHVMDQANVGHAMVNGLAFLKKWSEDDPERPAYYLDSDSRMVRARDTDFIVALAVQDFRASHPASAEAQLERIHPFIAGVDVTDLGGVDMIVKRVKEFPGVFHGIGELMSRHDDLTNLVTGERPRGNHPALFRIYDFAGEFNMPVSIHHNIAPISPSGEVKEPLYLPELLDAFREFPKTRFILCHVGISRRIVVRDLVGIADRILAEHADHVYFDLSWVVFPNYVLEDLDAWVRLIEKYPENFLLGSDVVGKFGNYRAEIRVFDELLSQLKPETARKLAGENFMTVMPRKGLVLPDDYTYPEMKYTRDSAPKP